MPANAQIIYDITFRIATFDNPVTEYMKDWLLTKLQMFWSIETEEEQAENEEPLSDLEIEVGRRLQDQTEGHENKGSGLSQNLKNSGFDSSNLREHLIKPAMLLVIILIIAAISYILHRLLSKFTLVEKYY